MSLSILYYYQIPNPVLDDCHMDDFTSIQLNGDSSFKIFEEKTMIQCLLVSLQKIGECSATF